MKSEKQSSTLPIAPLSRLIRENTQERVSESAARELGAILEDIGRQISIRAVDLAKHASRSTVKDADIRLAFKQMMK